jgi:hypothetical protein
MVTIGVKRFESDVNFGTGLDALERAKRAHARQRHHQHRHGRRG